MARRLLVLGFAALALVPIAHAGFSLPWNILDCEYTIAIVAVPASRIQPFVPPGFVPGMIRTPIADQFPDRPAGVGFETNTCASGAGLSGRVEPMQYASIWVGATPPPHLRVIGYDPYVNFDTLVPDDDRRALFASYGLPAHDGEVVIDDTEVDGVLRARHVTWTMEDFGTIAIDAAGAEASTGLSGDFMQYTASSSGKLARWTTDYAATKAYTHAGVVSFPEDSWLVDVFGATTMPARVLTGEWSYTNGAVAFPFG